MKASREWILRESSDEAADREDEASVFTRPEMMAIVREKLNYMRSGLREELLSGYEAGTVSRRGFLRLLGIGVGGGFLASTGFGLALRGDYLDGDVDRFTGFAGSEQDYETIKVPAGKEWNVIGLSSGETAENILIDMTEPNAVGRITCRGTDWELKNIGIRGTQQGHRNMYRQMLYLNVTQEGSTGVVQEIYMGDGTESGTGWAGMSAHRKHHAGTLKVRGVNIQRFGADGMYFSQPGVTKWNDAAMGEAHIEHCFAKNNNIENMRIGTPGSYIRDSVIHVESKQAVPANESDQTHPRGIWFKENDGLRAENCDVLVNGGEGIMASDGGGGEIVDCRVQGSPAIKGNVSGSNAGEPDIHYPEGVPCSPEQAARGTAGEE